ncbi:cysteine--tRNA ligase, partial [Patescibacteria group bacterium]|nr:cysteine--tRNA ligase [Patescibacteria group bacterium]
PTVYWNQHIGHMYCYVQWDVLVRFLKYLGYKTKWVMNLTDVGHMTSDEDAGEDKMEKGAKREGLTVWQIAEKYIQQFLASLDLLNINRPNILCRATDHIKEQIALAKKIEKNGFAYLTKTGLVFDTSKFPGYASFAKLNLKKQASGSRVKIDPEKKKPWDFLLWVTNQPDHIMLWDSPWGKGYPGWHIECTAMSTKYLGNQFDIHTGGKEHIPVHHTNEIAQSHGAFGKQTANYWLHNEWLVIDKEKMSKSLGNNVLVTDLISKGFNPLSLRYLILTSNYRQGLNFTWEALIASEKALNNLYNKALELKSSKGKLRKPIINKYCQSFSKAVGNDLNISQALGLTWKMLRSKELLDKEKYCLLVDFDKVFGLNLKEARLQEIPKQILFLAKQRESLRKEKKWQSADKIRKELEKLGWQIEDAKKGSVLKPTTNNR